MTWRDQIPRNATATFRGVKFHTVDGDLGVGRRSVTHEYPQRDDAYVQDLGRRARTFTVEGYVVGANYLTERDALVAALEADGPGELVHPRYGTRYVAVQDVAHVKESAREGGIAHFSITFVETARNLLPNSTPDTTALVQDASESVETAAGNAFANTIDLSGPQALANDMLKAVSKDLQGLVKIATQVTSTASLAALMQQVNLITGSLATLIRTPLSLVQSLQGINQQLVVYANRPVAALAEYRAVFAGTPRASTSSRANSTPARAVINDNARTDLQRRTALAQQARLLTAAISDGAVTTATQAVALRNALLVQVDTELETSDPDAATSLALTSLRTAVTRDVAARVELLRQTSTFHTMIEQPALLLAHRIYQDARRADELVARNAVRHPAFVPPGDIEVLQ